MKMNISMSEGAESTGMNMNMNMCMDMDKDNMDMDMDMDMCMCMCMCMSVRMSMQVHSERSSRELCLQPCLPFLGFATFVADDERSIGFFRFSCVFCSAE